jgi:hypothetical protein
MIGPTPTFARFAAALSLMVSLCFAHSASALRPDPKPRSVVGMCAMSTGLAAGFEPTALPSGDEDLPWCTSADDPRCSRPHDDAVPLQVASRLAAAAHVEITTPSWVDAGEQKLTPSTGLAPRAGVPIKVERPPRAR